MCIYICKCVLIYQYICVYIYIYICIYIYIYIYTYTHAYTLVYKHTLTYICTQLLITVWSVIKNLLKHVCFVRSTFFKKHFKEVSDLKSYAVAGRLFYGFITRILKKSLRAFIIQRCLTSLYEWPRVILSVRIEKKVWHV